MTTAPTQQVRRPEARPDQVRRSAAATSTTDSMRTTGTRRSQRRHHSTQVGYARSGRLGSKQQVSVRGRRIATQQTENVGRARQILIALVIVVLGVGAVMWISAATTEQSFQIQQAQQKSDQLDNEIETLQRDVRQAQSSGHIAAEAARMGMVVPEKPGILQTNGDAVDEVRGADASKTREVIDVNGDVSNRRATSDPKRTNRVEGLAAEEAVAADGVAAASPVRSDGAAPEGDAADEAVANNNVLPYSNSGGAPAAEAPAAPPAEMPAN